MGDPQQWIAALTALVKDCEARGLNWHAEQFRRRLARAKLAAGMPSAAVIAAAKQKPSQASLSVHVR